MAVCIQHCLLRRGEGRVGLGWDGGTVPLSMSPPLPSPSPPFLPSPRTDTQPLAVQYSRERLKPTRSVPTRSSSFTSSTRVSVLLRRRGCEDQRLRSNSSGSAGSGAVSTSPTPLRVSSPTQRVLQLIKVCTFDDLHDNSLCQSIHLAHSCTWPAKRVRRIH